MKKYICLLAKNRSVNLTRSQLPLLLLRLFYFKAVKHIEICELNVIA